MPYSRFLIGFILILILGISFLFREDISRLLDFGSLPSTSLLPLATDNPTTGAPTTKKEPENKSAAAGSQSIFTTSGALLPPYTGRDPAEIRPVLEEVKLFTEDQKRQIFDSLGAEARAVKLNPVHFTGWINIGLLKKIIGDFEGARDAWEYASLIEPLNSLSFSNLGELYWRYLHEYLKSEANLRTSVAHKPDDIQNYVSLAELYHYSYKEKYEFADDVLLEGLKVNPDNGTLMRRLAYLYEQRKEWKLALEWWEKVLRVASGDEEVKNSINKVKAKLEGGNN